jgi:hypothetical protein
MTKRALSGLAAVLLVAIAGGCSSAAASAKPVDSAKPVASAGPVASAKPATFHVDWMQSDFVQSSCPSAHATATACFSGTAAGTLPEIGPVALQRTVYTTGPEDAKGCLTAVTDGTLTASDGVLTFHATGTLCDQLATYQLTKSSGTGSLAGLTVTGTITNDSGSETWSGTVTRS